MNILVINGPNLNMLGIREPDIYGNSDYNCLCNMIKNKAENLNVSVEIFQSNHEGYLVDKIQEAFGKTDGIIINPGAFTHTSIAIADALDAVKIPYVEVHISDVSKREEFRQISFIRNSALKTIMGMGLEGYTEALEFLVKENCNEYNI